MSEPLGETPRGSLQEPVREGTLSELLQGELVFFDTEACGGKPGDRMVEMAAIRYSGGREVGRYRSLVDPGMPVPERAVRIHGLRQEELRGQPFGDVVLREFLDFAEGAALVAYHVRFDARLLSYEAARYGMRLGHWPCFDIRHAVKPILGSQRPKQSDLGTLVEFLGIELGDAHRAMVDTENLIAVAFALDERRNGQNSPRLFAQSLDLDMPRIPVLPPELELLAPSQQPPVVEIDYDGKLRGRAWRPVIPSMLFRSRRRDLLRAYCMASSSNKLYHLTRIRGVRSKADGSEAEA